MEKPKSGTLPKRVLTDTEAKRIHDEAVVIDGLAGSAKQVDRLLKAGITAANVTVGQTENFMETVKIIADYLLLIDALPEKALLVETAEDILRAKREGKLGIIFGFQGAAPIEDDFTLISIFHKLGLRIFQLTYQQENHLGYSCMDLEDRGLTRFGREVVRELNRLGIVLDLSHVGIRTSMDAMEVSKQPAIFSHSNPKGVCDHPRNLTDEQIKAVAQTGGVIGISPYSIFCETTPGVWPTLDDYVTCIDYVVNLVGPDHVGLGSDKFEGKSRAEFQKFWIRYRDMFPAYGDFSTRQVQGLQDIESLPRVTELLARRGYDEATILKILGGNFLRVFSQVWRG